MKLTEGLQAVYDCWRPNRWGIRPYLIRDGIKHPFAVICPGGAYGMVCSFVEGLPYAKALNEKGFHAIVVYYRVRKQARYPAPQQDLQRAISTAFSHAEDWNLDTKNWSLWGSSAGGHLAASFLAEQNDGPKPNVLILTYPVITMGERTHQLSRQYLIGKDPDPMLVERLSAEKHITEDYPPTYIWNGTADNIVDPINSRMLTEALQNAGVSCQYEEFEGVGHGVGLAKKTAAEPWFEHAVEFWEKRMK